MNWDHYWTIIVQVLLALVIIAVVLFVFGAAAAGIVQAIKEKK